MRKSNIDVWVDVETSKIGLPEWHFKDVAIRAYLVGWEDDVYGYREGSELDFFKDLVELCKFHTITLVAHNIQYELEALIYWLIPMDELHGGNVRVSWNVTDRKLFLNCVFTSEYITFTTHDTWLWDKHKSIESWAKELGIKTKTSYLKANFDYDKWNAYVDWETRQIYYTNSKGEPKVEDLDKELEYLENDVKMIPNILEKINQIQRAGYKALDLVEKKNTENKYWARRILTPGSFAKDGMNKAILGEFDDRFRRRIDHNNWNLLKMTYDHRALSNGGLTGFWKTLNHVVAPKGKLIVHQDMKSAYPTEMIKPLPYGDLYEEEPEEPHVKFFVCKIKKLKYKKELAEFSQLPIPEHALKQLNRDDWMGHGLCWLSEEYYKTILSCCENKDIKLKKIFYQKTTSIMAPTMQKLFDLRMKNKPGSLTEQAVKIMINSIYGKTLENPRDMVIKYEVEERSFIKYKKPIEKIDNRIYTTGIYIIQQVRAKLLRNMLEQIAGGNQILYVDTDGIWYIENKKLKNSEIERTQGKLLGCWDKKFPNSEFTEFWISGKAKRYLAYSPSNNKIVFCYSGLADKVRDKLLETFQIDVISKLFNPEENILFKGCDSVNKKNKYSMTLIYDCDLESNNTIEPTGCITMSKGKLTYQEYKKRPKQISLKDV